MKVRHGVKRTFRRAVVLSATVALLLGMATVPAGAENADDLEARLREEVGRRIGDVQDYAQGLEAQAKDTIGEGLRAYANGDVAGVKSAIDDLGQTAECAEIEAGLLFGHNPQILNYDLAAGKAYAQVVVPEGCTLSRPIPVTLVSWTLTFGIQWPLSDQLRADTNSVTVQNAGTYNLEVDLPRPTLDPQKLDQAAELNLGPAADGPLGDLLGGIDLDSIIDGIVGSLTPEQISGILDFICPFQVDVVRAEESAVPAVLGGGGLGDVNLTAPGLDVSTLMAGTTLDTGGIAAAGRDARTAATSTLDASAEGDAGGGLDLAALDFEVLCADGPEVATDQETKEPVAVLDASTGGGTEVAGAQTPLPRTGAETPGVVAVGLALIVAGWLVLTANAAIGYRRRDA